MDILGQILGCYVVCASPRGLALSINMPPMNGFSSRNSGNIACG